jgi:ubiquinone/menaquinone biosynthesis C-methylase UbiE
LERFPEKLTECVRLDMAHHLWNLILKGCLYKAPLDHPQRVLDLGTGTGIWAIDFGDMYHEAEVIGTGMVLLIGGRTELFGLG